MTTGEGTRPDETNAAEEVKPAEEPKGLPKFTASVLAPGVHWLQIADDSWKTGHGAHVTIAGTANGAVVIDTAYGMPAPASFIAGYLAGLGYPPVKAILLTHNHRDHSGGAAHLRETTGAPIWCHPLEAPLVIESTKVEAKDDQPEQPGTVVDGALTDGQVIDAGGIEIQVVHTPGHAPGHCCFFLPQSGIMITGDLVLGSATTSVSPPHGSMVDLLKSLEQLLDFPMTLIVPAHGPLITNPRENVQGVLDHRRERENQVLAALAEGEADAPAIVSRVYQDLSEKLVELAAKQVTSILKKLEQEQRVVAIGDGEVQTWRLA